jgi:hypothetical protein
MTVTEFTVRPPLAQVAFDTYRDIHKGIRADLFAVTGDAGRLDPADRLGRAALADHVNRLGDFLVDHAEHEDAVIQPVLQRELPDLAAQIEHQHGAIEDRIVTLRELAATAAGAAEAERRHRVHQLYIELASFTGDFLAHQDVEERVVAPALERAVGVEAVFGMHLAILAQLAPAQMAQGLSLMLPAMNVDDRTELLAGVRDSKPAEVVTNVLSLARSVLATDEYRQVAARLGLA